MSAIAFFDLGTTCGCAVGSPGDISAFDWDLKLSAKEEWALRFIRFWKKLEQLHEAWKLKAIGFEDVHRHIGTEAAHCYGAYKALLLAFCHLKGIPCEGVGVGTLKKFWTGKGNATKHQMIEEARKRGFEPTSDNEADAIAGLHWLFAADDVADVKAEAAE